MYFALLDKFSIMKILKPDDNFKVTKEVADVKVKLDPSQTI